MAKPQGKLSTTTVPSEIGRDGSERGISYLHEGKHYHPGDRVPEDFDVSRFETQKLPGREVSGLAEPAVSDEDTSASTGGTRAGSNTSAKRKRARAKAGK